MPESRYSSLSDDALEKIQEQALNGSSSHNLKDIKDEWARRYSPVKQPEPEKPPVDLGPSQKLEIPKRHFPFPNSHDDPKFAADVSDMMAGELQIEDVAKKHSYYPKKKG
jgi:hypothetical protein